MTYFRLLPAALLSVCACQTDSSEPQQHASEHVVALAHDISPPLAELATQTFAPFLPAQTVTPLITSFEGMGQGLPNYWVSTLPPSSVGDVGPQHFVQVVNSQLTVFDKSGTPLYGPIPTNNLWAGDSRCSVSTDGDALVRYDRFADRWVISQLSSGNGSNGSYECVAVSTSSNPVGSYARYAFKFPNQEISPTLALWPDAYYLAFNTYQNGSFSGSKVCALDRAKMMIGAPAPNGVQCFDTSADFGGLLIADLDGPTPPPAGASAHVFGLGYSNTLASFQLHIDWSNPSLSKLTGPTLLPVAAYTPLCDNSWCVPQLGTSTGLAPVSDRLMNRAAYRNFGDHEAVVLGHAINAGGSGGIRWYELRNLENPSIFQSGTFAPDGNVRWMGSLAFDGAGNLGAAYSVSGITIHPGIRRASRSASDPAGTLGNEQVIMDGQGSQTSSGNWGNFSSLNVDPVDDCTFWYSGEYLTSNGSFNWHTRIASFRLPGCGASVNDFSLAVVPGSAALASGGTVNLSVNTALTVGTAEDVALSTSGLPANVSATFNPTTVSAGNSSTLTLTGGPGSHPNSAFRVIGTSTHASHSASVGLSCERRSCGSFCGTMDDGCGGSIECGCKAPATCGGAGVDNQCGTCQPRRCHGGCGVFDDGCGGELCCGNAKHCCSF